MPKIMKISEMNKEELDAEVKSWLWHRESTVN
jgi:hypothetical protein